MSTSFTGSSALAAVSDGLVSENDSHSEATLAPSPPTTPLVPVPNSRWSSTSSTSSTSSSSAFPKPDPTPAALKRDPLLRNRYDDDGDDDEATSKPNPRINRSLSPPPLLPRLRTQFKLGRATTSPAMADEAGIASTTGGLTIRTPRYKSEWDNLSTACALDCLECSSSLLSPSPFPSSPSSDSHASSSPSESAMAAMSSTVLFRDNSANCGNTDSLPPTVGADGHPNSSSSSSHQWPCPPPSASSSSSSSTASEQESELERGPAHGQPQGLTPAPRPRPKQPIDYISHVQSWRSLVDVPHALHLDADVFGDGVKGARSRALTFAGLDELYIFGVCQYGAVGL